MRPLAKFNCMHFLFDLVGLGKRKIIHMVQPVNQDGCYTYIWQKPLKIFVSRSEELGTWKLGKKQWELEAFEVCSNGDPRNIKSQIYFALHVYMGKIVKSQRMATGIILTLIIRPYICTPNSCQRNSPYTTWHIHESYSQYIVVHKGLFVYPRGCLPLSHGDHVKFSIKFCSWESDDWC